jgi:hypothetical protein
MIYGMQYLGGWSPTNTADIITIFSLSNNEKVIDHFPSMENGTSCRYLVSNDDFL